MNTRRHDTRILRCDQRGCGVSFMGILGDDGKVQAKIGLAFPRPVARDGKGQDMEDTCPRHKD